jgi:hypothetical protein
MKTLIFAVFVLPLFSCSKPFKNGNESFPDYKTAEEDWITYEGVLPSGDREQVVATLQLMPGSPGMDAHFKLNETPLPGKGIPHIVFVKSEGNYSVLLGSGVQHVIHITRRRFTGSLTIGKPARPSDQVAEDLYFKGDNDRLVLVDDDFEPIAPGYSLLRRSDLFTVEGYVTVYPDTSAEFFERNTQKNWHVAQLACYDETVAKYHLLAKEKFEGIYVKALSYSVPQSDGRGENFEALVFKRILAIDSLAPKQPR